MEVETKTDYRLIETDRELQDIIPYFEKADRMAVDLEADSMFHFREKVCLIQIATEDTNALIDPLKVRDLSSIKLFFESRDIKKIFHGADYDIRSLYRDFGIEVNNLFDTELASRFLGVKSSGLNAVLKERFNVSLDKKYQKKDWSQRPLPPGMLEYAACDALYLLSLAEILEQELAEKGRADWVEEECELLSNVRAPEENSSPLYLRFKGAGRLKPRELSILENILKYRMAVAEKKDRPLYKVFGNSNIMSIVHKRPDTVGKLRQMKLLAPRQCDMYGRDLVSCINDAMEVPCDELPHYPKTRAPRPDPRVPGRVRAIKEWRDDKAKRLDIEPGLLLNKALITALAVKKPESVCELDSIEDMKNWQKVEFGDSLIGRLTKVR